MSHAPSNRLLLEIARTAYAMVEGRTTFIEGARQLTRLWADTGFDQHDPDIVPMIAIDSETDALPFGGVRELWAPDALAKLQPDIERSETWARQTGMESCLHLIERFGLSAIRRQIADTARAMLEGRLSVAEGSHRLVSLRDETELSRTDADFGPFGEISEKCDFLPLTDGREHWSKEKLEKSFPEIVRAEEWATRTGLPHCQKLIDRFGR